MRRYRVGWDVGGWHCDRNRESRDALAILEIERSVPRVVGRPWRGNLRDLLMSKTGPELMMSMLALCGLSNAGGESEVTVAIDTPLGWPRAMLDLVLGRATSFVSADDRVNPYTRRRTEIALIERGIATPLSAVRDMIGSQSTKGIHFLRGAGLVERATGVWSGSNNDMKIVAIETYPAAAVATGGIERLFEAVYPPADKDAATRSAAAFDDLDDALRCAIVAHLFADEPELLDPPPTEVPDGVGWIMLPRQTRVAGRPGREASRHV
jgi:hypothetical protein